MKKILLMATILALFVATSVFAQTKGYYWYALEVVDEFGQVRDDETITFTVDAGGTIYSDRGDTVQSGLTTTDGTYTFYYNVATATITVADAAGTVSKDITNLDRRILLCDQTYLMTSAVTMSSTLTVEGNIVTAAGVDVTLYGSTTGDYFGLDASDNEIDLIDLDLQFDDDADCIFGTGNDWVVDSDTATKLDFIPLTTDETSAINVGANTAGADLMLYGATTGEYWLWDASADSILPNCGNALFTMTDAEANQFKVDATGTVAGIAIQLETTSGAIKLLADGAGTGDITLDAEGLVSVVSAEAAANQFKVDAVGTIDGDAIVLETTNGGIQLLADGVANGDIDIDCEDDLTLTAAGNMTLAVTGTLSAGGALLTNVGLTTEVVAGTTDALTATQSGSVIVYTMTGAVCTVTLPEATATEVGVYFILIDGNPTAGQDLSIDPEGVGTINGDTAGHYIKCENDRDGEGVLIFCTAADTWYTMACGSSTVWTEE